MALTVEGKLFEIFDESQVTENFKKREFVLEIPAGSYTQYPKFQLTQKNCGVLDNFSVGDEVSVTFELTCKPFVKNGETLYFTNLQAWRVDGVSSNNTPQMGSSRSSVTTTPSFMDDQDDDLPF
jgi:single-strand DNA-binding protein